ncbi:cellulose synthase [Gammaproteobacteria bacterium 45_16_T64]|nr:cellulose synthase [Gammaproteobacteria bacterium 45_16_T64]
MGFYFDEFEGRVPPEPVKHSLLRELFWQFIATINLCVGGWYIHWRWTESLNYDALWFSIPLVIAESAAYIGLILFTYSLWKTDDKEITPPPQYFTETVNDDSAEARPLRVDVFFPTYDEEPELVELSVKDALKITYPHDIELNIYILDDGRRDSMQRLADKHGVKYLTRDNNVGFKAGNLRNAMENTGGDFIVICDADTRPFPTILSNTLGYFRDPDVAWVQTPQWFFDLPEGRNLEQYLDSKVGFLGRYTGKLIEMLVGEIRFGSDPFVNCPQMFYDVIQRRRNWANASFCCGAGSIHRREPVMQVALKSYGEQIEKEEAKNKKALLSATKESSLDENVEATIRQNIANEIEVTPYKFHVSEDIYTSIMLHSDVGNNWKSVMHPFVESKMLSPQDLQTWMVQRFKYAGGTIDIALNDNPVFRKGMSLPQRMMYASTIWSYFGALWNVIFILAPIIYLFTGVAPVSAYSLDFYIHVLPFMMLNELAFMIGTWGVAGFKGKSSFISFFSVNIKAIAVVLMGKKIAFPTTPKERQEGTFIKLVIPQILVIILTISAVSFAVSSYFFMGNIADHSFNGIVTNLFWAANNIILMSGMVLSAFWKPPAPEVEELVMEHV